MLYKWLYGLFTAFTMTCQFLQGDTVQWSKTEPVKLDWWVKEVYGNPCPEALVDEYMCACISVFSHSGMWTLPSS